MRTPQISSPKKKPIVHRTPKNNHDQKPATPTNEPATLRAPNSATHINCVTSTHQHQLHNDHDIIPRPMHPLADADDTWHPFMILIPSFLCCRLRFHTSANFGHCRLPIVGICGLVAGQNCRHKKGLVCCLVLWHVDFMLTKVRWKNMRGEVSQKIHEEIDLMANARVSVVPDWSIKSCSWILTQKSIIRVIETLT